MGVKRTRTNEAARGLAIAAARLADQRNCEDVVILDLREISPVTDYFVICTGTSDRQMRSVADELGVYGKSVGQRVWHVAGKESAEWIVLDFVDVVVHLFGKMQRDYYDLELIWGAAPRVKWQ
ncbi:MAG: ribosome silencing factor [Planctomycetota bacterium]